MLRNASAQVNKQHAEVFMFVHKNYYRLTVIILSWQMLKQFIRHRTTDASLILERCEYLSVTVCTGFCVILLINVLHLCFVSWQLLTGCSCLGEWDRTPSWDRWRAETPSPSSPWQQTRCGGPGRENQQVQVRSICVLLPSYFCNGEAPISFYLTSLLLFFLINIFHIFLHV